MQIRVFAGHPNADRLALYWYCRLHHEKLVVEPGGHPGELLAHWVIH